ncbi:MULTISPECIES: HTH-type transcriptional regulator ArgP [Delftia]|jgi:LysR family transcriptional regulator (chromosome initiation inhibitor)|uniref:Transcriptional regulator, LysR family n=5 Tax=Pseudomonadati TaxID=3379134 RepID=A9BVW1_DELAS|nr:MULTISPECIES: HTH-type transcriptional regulator ArgP [Delftia]MBA4002986.1 ArgP/LysG family DNA-binding transcriptional regulator [Delftia sp.]OLE92231.1 MAG: transcriptional regulator ArgP [Delftia sp. 13_1_40CM_3_66_6]PIF38534.1 LysR family transcriptional regulator (chromosome initiation inhibitor) [Burkholderiales bacterium 23]ABX35474.1 transcriptional regulator, LysR family [Delftia acidovorans SPH-1]AEF90908.1 transcriptional regulator, ArgP, LysR family [Delftia sp. Cs1-4]
MLDYAGLEALAAVVREGSFERAARKLHVTPSAVSQRIKLLEERVGQVLVLRGQPCSGTDAGRRLCLHLEQVALLENDLRRKNPELVPEGQTALPTLKLAVNADSLSTWFMDAMSAFTRDGNELLDISIDDQDHTAKRIREGEVLAAVTATSSAIPGCNTWPLGRMRYVAAASPDFIRRYLKDGITPEAMARTPMMSYGRKDSLQDQWLQRLGAEGRRNTPRHFLPSNQGYTRACELGMGWGMHPPLMIGAQLAEGSLVELLPGNDLDIPMYWAHARNAQASLQRLTDCVIQAAAACLDPME